MNTHKPPSNIDVGFAARALVLEYNRKVSHKVSNVLKFQKGVLALLSNLSLHFIEKSPLKNTIVKCAQCFDPVYMESNRCDAENEFTFLLQKLLAFKRLPSGKTAEQAKEQIRTLNDTVSLEYEKFQLLTELMYSLAITCQLKSIAMFSQYFS